MAYELKTDRFSGPLDKLLELIEARELPISDISLAQVTDDFLKYLESLKEVQFAFLADFIAIASKLILIKSKSLLPELELTEEEESDIKDLEKRLQILHELRGAKEHLQKLWLSGRESFARPYFLNAPGAISVFSPGDIKTENLESALNRLFEIVQKLNRETEVIREKIISLEEKIQEVIQRVSQAGEMTFDKLKSAKSKAEIIAIFLAILHLAREELVQLEQTSHFSDILIKAKSG